MIFWSGGEKFLNPIRNTIKIFRKYQSEFTPAATITLAVIR
jgi:hypothetical protein